MADRLLVVVLLVLHFALLGFMIVGGFFAWKWPAVVVFHVPLVIWGVLNSIYQLQCPVTSAENWARRRAGVAEYEGGFIETYVEGVFYPAHHVNRARLIALALVLGSWVGVYLFARYRAVVRLRHASAVLAASVLVPRRQVALLEDNSVM
ncbi:MAG: DUF2784 domain-containing protein [Umezawaea sp.]